MTEYTARVKVVNGKAKLKYQNFFSENLYNIRVSVIALYSKFRQLTPIIVTCNGSLQQIRDPIYNVLAMTTFLELGETVQFSTAIDMPMVICPTTLQFRILNEEDQLVDNFEGALLVKLAGKFKQNVLI